MKLTTKRRYAVTAMLDVALHQSKGPVSVVDIAKRQGISQSYLEQLFSKLRHGGLVTSTRGPGGGYSIVGDLQKLTVLDVINAIEEKELEQTHCRGLCSCQQGQECLTKQLWTDLSRVMHNFLSGVTFAQLVQGATETKTGFPPTRE
ncbi:MAG: Rrf2 family transcriptional regulator [Pseudomonadota bacterium]|nr:Rrf2 family transcriptional regulator [Gammaproteobacteria bacterium]MBU1927024.1 Rrf2 family transcriptional regulator [Gammaproteobacteria bacterium]MBU2546390.1 Rrf2 family transcriptional regulator [Gammaproteobacteria bacterium]